MSTVVRVDLLESLLFLVVAHSIFSVDNDQPSAEQP
jgi:hypothetical protein